MKIVKNDEFRDFFSSNNLSYIDENVIRVRSFFHRRPRHTGYYRRNREEFDSLSRLYRGDLAAGNRPITSIRRVSDEVGWGLFAEQPLSPGDLVGQYTGVVQKKRRLKSADRALADHAWDYPGPAFPPLEINASAMGNELRFVNSSLSPNLTPDHMVFKDQWIIIFVVSQPVATGDELTIDYGDAYWTCDTRELWISEEEYNRLSNPPERRSP